MSQESEPLIIADPELLMPEGQRFVLDESMLDPDDPKPTFTVQEVAKFFFGKGADWLRWRSSPDKPKKKGEPPKRPDGWFILDGKKIEPRRTPAGARYYTLVDVERMAHALAQNGGIDGSTLGHIVLLVKTCAKVYDLIP